MANVLLCYPNKAEGATLSGGAWLTALPVSNLLSAAISQLARTSNATPASTWFSVNFGRTQGVRAIALANHNLSVAARIRVRASADPTFTTTTYDSGFASVWSSIYSSADLEWEDDNWWSGVLSAEQLGTSRPLWVSVLPAIAYGWYWRIDIDDTGNGDGYVEAGRLLMAPAWAPASNMSYGAAYRWEPKADMAESLGGTRYYLPRSNGRLQSFSLDYLTAAEAFTSVLEMQRELGADGELLVVADSDDPVAIQTRSYVARLDAMGDVRILGPAQHSAQITLREVL